MQHSNTDYAAPPICEETTPSADDRHSRLTFMSQPSSNGEEFTCRQAGTALGFSSMGRRVAQVSQTGHIQLHVKFVQAAIQ